LTESELENQAGSRYLENKSRIVKLPGMSTSKPSKNRRVSGKNPWFFTGSLQVLFLFNSFAESELGPSRSVHRSRAYMPGLTSSKEPVEIKGPPNTGSNPAEVITPTGYQYQHPFSGIRGQGHGL
jgi:hypothetical protein